MHCLVISMRGIEPYRKLRRTYTLGSKVKELVNLSSLCKFQLFAINKKGNSCNPKLPNKPYHGFGSHLDKKATA